MTFRTWGLNLERMLEGRVRDSTLSNSWFRFPGLRFSKTIHTFHTIHNKLKPIQCDQCTFASPYKRKKETIDRHVNTIHKPSSSEIPTTLDQDKPHIEPPEKKLKPDQLPSATNESKIEFDNNSLNEILNQNILFCPQCNCNNGR